MHPGARQRKREREDALFRRILLEGGRVSDEDVKKAIRERSRLSSRGVELTLYQVLLKMRLVDLPEVKRIFARIGEEFAFCQACGQEVGLDGSLDCPACGRSVDPGQTQVLTPPTGAQRPVRPSPSTRIEGDALIGQLLGNCRLEEKVGEGGMGVVYRARHIALDKVVAVKVLASHLGQQSEKAKRFVREARTMARVGHANVLAIHDVQADQGRYWIVMEFCRGVDFGRLLAAEGQLPPRRAIELTLQACRGLAALHAEGIVHRDLKPENLMLDADGVVKVMDFSLARQMTANRDLTLSDEILGTPYYMSPEQCTGRPLDARSDIYSLGATLYQILTGQRPFGGDSPVDVIMKHLFEEPIAPHRLNKAVGSRLGRVVLKMMAKSPDHRYADCAALEHDLQLVARGKNPLAAPLLSGKLRQRVQRVALGGGALLVLIAAGFAWALGRGAAAGEPDREPAEEVRRPAPARSGEEIGAYQALLGVLETMRDRHDMYPGLIERFEDLRVQYVGTEAAALAAERIVEMKAVLVADGEAWWAEHGPTIDGFLADDDYPAALEHLETGFPAELRHFESEPYSVRFLARSKEINDRQRQFRADLAAEGQRLSRLHADLFRTGEYVRLLELLDAVEPRFARRLDDLPLWRGAAVAAAEERFTELVAEFWRRMEGGEHEAARGVLEQMKHVAVGDRIEERGVLVTTLQGVEADRAREQNRAALETALASLRSQLLAWKFDEVEGQLEEIAADPRYADFGGRIARVAREAAAYRQVIEAARETVDRLETQRTETTVEWRREGHDEAQTEAGLIVETSTERFLLEVSLKIGDSVGSRTRDVRFRDLTPASLTRFARQSLDLGRPDSILALAIYHLIDGRYEDAAEQMALLPDGHGLDVAIYERQIDDDRFTRLLDGASQARDAGRLVDAWRDLEEALARRPGDPRATRDQAILRPAFEDRHLSLGDRFYDRTAVVREPLTDPAAFNRRWRWSDFPVHASVEPEGRVLRLYSDDVSGADNRPYLIVRNDALENDLAAGIVVSFLDAPAGAAVGFFFRARLDEPPQRHGYLVFVTRDGLWAIDAHVDGQFVRLGKGKVEPFALGDRIALDVFAVGPRIEVRIDGVALPVVVDATHTRGELGLVVHDGVRVDVSRIRVDRLVAHED